METLVYLVDGFWRERTDPRVSQDYPFLSGGPLPVLAIVAIYLYFVRVLGPKWMKSREPFEITGTIRIYNIGMSLMNLYMFIQVSIMTRFGIDYFGCHQVGKSKLDNALIPIGCLYVLTKIVELLDTVFFIMRKKYNQASNLHVFHHSFIAVCTWSYIKLAPGGSSVVFPYLNMGIHTIMYGYYFFATFPQAQKYLWWKRYLTAAQMIQFALSMIHFSFQGLSTCAYPPALAVIGFFFNFVFLVLFADFYYAAYIKAPTKRAELANKKQPQQLQLQLQSHQQHQQLEPTSKGSQVAKATNLRSRQSAGIAAAAAH